MKHIFYVLLAALALFLAACKKDKKPVPVYLDGTWLQIGDAGLIVNWYPPSVDKQLRLENNRYTHYYKNAATLSGSFELLNVTERGTDKTVLGIRFDGGHDIHTATVTHDTLCIRPNNGGDWADYYIKAK